MCPPPSTERWRRRVRNDPSAPWGGFKESGIGRENGRDSHHEYTQAKAVVVRLAASKEDWFGDVAARYN